MSSAFYFWIIPVFTWFQYEKHFALHLWPKFSVINFSWLAAGQNTNEGTMAIQCKCMYFYLNAYTYFKDIDVFLLKKLFYSSTNLFVSYTEENI